MDVLACTVDVLTCTEVVLACTVDVRVLASCTVAHSRRRKFNIFTPLLLQIFLDMILDLFIAIMIYTSSVKSL